MHHREPTAGTEAAAGLVHDDGAIAARTAKDGGARVASRWTAKQVVAHEPELGDVDGRQRLTAIRAIAPGVRGGRVGIYDEAASHECSVPGWASVVT